MSSEHPGFTINRMLTALLRDVGALPDDNPRINRSAFTTIGDIPPSALIRTGSSSEIITIPDSPPNRKASPSATITADDSPPKAKVSAGTTISKCTPQSQQSGPSGVNSTNIRSHPRESDIPPYLRAGPSRNQVIDTLSNPRAGPSGIKISDLKTNPRAIKSWVKVTDFPPYPPTGTRIVKTIQFPPYPRLGPSRMRWCDILPPLRGGPSVWKSHEIPLYPQASQRRIKAFDVIPYQREGRSAIKTNDIPPFPTAGPSGRTATDIPPYQGAVQSGNKAIYSSAVQPGKKSVIVTNYSATNPQVTSRVIEENRRAVDPPAITTVCVTSHIVMNQRATSRVSVTTVSATNLRVSSGSGLHTRVPRPLQKLKDIITNYLAQPDTLDYMEHFTNTSEGVSQQSTETSRFHSVPMPLDFSLTPINDAVPSVNHEDSDKFLSRLRREYPETLLYELPSGKRKFSPRKRILLNSLNYLHSQYKLAMREHVSRELFQEVYGERPETSNILCQEYEDFAHLNELKVLPDIANLSTLEEIVEYEYQGLGFLPDDRTEPKISPQPVERPTEDRPWWIDPDDNLSECRDETAQDSDASQVPRLHDVIDLETGETIPCEEPDITHTKTEEINDKSQVRSEEQPKLATKSVRRKKEKRRGKSNFRVRRKHTQKSSLRLTIKKIPSKQRKKKSSRPKEKNNQD